MNCLGQDEEVPRRWCLYLGEFFLEVLYENLMKASRRLHRLFADDLETLIERGEDLFVNESPCFQDFLYIGSWAAWLNS